MTTKERESKNQTKRISAQNWKNFVKKLLLPIVYVTRHVFINVRPKPKTHNLLTTVVRNRAIETSADYIEQNISKAMLFDSIEMLWDFALSKITVQGLYVEFGVFSGYSINYFSNKITNKNFYGFDSFEGLREDWVGTSVTKGTFNLDGILPKVNANVSLVRGWFDDSLPNFLKKHSDDFSFIHFDADTYESTALLLDLIGHRIVKGTVVVFDEYLGFANWQNGEYRAWKQFIEKENISYEYLGFSIQQTAIRIV